MKEGRQKLQITQRMAWKHLPEVQQQKHLMFLISDQRGNRGELTAIHVSSVLCGPFYSECGWFLKRGALLTFTELPFLETVNPALDKGGCPVVSIPEQVQANSLHLSQSFTHLSSAWSNIY